MDTFQSKNINASNYYLNGELITFGSGAQGATGDTGQQGNIGISGVPGSSGIHGSQGKIGIKGSQGITGLKGDSSSVGAQGAQGNRGFKGNKGIEGLQGDPSPVGAQGAQGNIGAQGNKGIEGLQGDPAATGAQGVQGNIGAQGNKGIEGLQGDPAATGAQGAQGNIGTQGNLGIEGEYGSQGNPGNSDVRNFTYGPIIINGTKMYQVAWCLNEYAPDVKYGILEVTLHGAGGGGGGGIPGGRDYPQGPQGRLAGAGGGGGAGGEIVKGNFLVGKDTELQFDFGEGGLKGEGILNESIPGRNPTFVTSEVAEAEGEGYAGRKGGDSTLVITLTEPTPENNTILKAKGGGGGGSAYNTIDGNTLIPYHGGKGGDGYFAGGGGGGGRGLYWGQGGPPAEGGQPGNVSIMDDSTPDYTSAVYNITARAREGGPGGTVTASGTPYGNAGGLGGEGGSTINAWDQNTRPQDGAAAVIVDGCGGNGGGIYKGIGGYYTAGASPSINGTAGKEGSGGGGGGGPGNYGPLVPPGTGLVTGGNGGDGGDGVAFLKLTVLLYND